MHTVHTYTYMHTHSHINTYIYIRCLHAYYTHSKKIHAMFFIFILFPLFGFLRTFIELLHAGSEGLLDITVGKKKQRGDCCGHYIISTEARAGECVVTN